MYTFIYAFKAKSDLPKSNGKTKKQHKPNTIIYSFISTMDFHGLSM